MNKLLIVTAAGAIMLGAAGVYAGTRSADAQDVGPDAIPHRWQSADGGDHGWGMGHDGGRRHHRWMMQHDFGLFYPVADKNLSVADVQVIAQAMLLRHGNHTWKVADVVQNQDNTVSFAFTTPDGGVVARFAVQTQTGRLHRVG